MPNTYKRKPAGAKRRQWSQNDLQEAIRRINAGEMGVNEAARNYKIPSRTLRRRRQSGVLTEIPLGPQGTLGIENERRLVTHIQKLEKAGFAPDRDTVRSLAFQFAEKLGMNHRFNKEKQMAGYVWLESFMRRNKDLAIRESQGLSLARSEGMNRSEVTSFFNILTDVFTQYDMLNTPGKIFNMDETGYQINNEAGTVIATKGAKNVHTLISSERGENVSIIACCSADGTFLPPVVIFKGVREKKEFSDGLPPGSKVFMNQKSSYITSDLFFKWLKEHFVPKKPPGRVILILDGHASHRNSLQMLGFAEENEITLICLPSHTTQALQPLDRSFFKSLKHNLRRFSRQWIINHPGRRITRLQAGTIIGKAWGKAASVETGLSGFRATGISPLDPTVIPEHFFAISDAASLDNGSTKETVAVASKQCRTELPIESQSPVPSTSQQSEPPKPESSVSCPKITPSKYLHEIRPVPVLPEKQQKRKKQSAAVLTPASRTQNTIHNPRKKIKQKTTAAPPEDVSCESDSSICSDVPLAHLIPKQTKCNQQGTINLKNSFGSDEEQCVECLEAYFLTTERVDWIQCLICTKWMHETCTMYLNKCNICGRDEKRQEKAKAAQKQLHKRF